MEHFCEIISKSDQRFRRRRFFKNFCMPVQCKKKKTQKNPFIKAKFIDGSKFLRTIFEEGHPRNTPLKLFQNLTSAFGEEDFLRISSCPFSASSPYSLELCLLTDQILKKKKKKCLERVTQGKFL